MPTQHFESATLLWLQRDVAVTDAQYLFQDLVELDHRLEEQLNGLRSAASNGWLVCEKQLDYENAGTLFTSSVIAFESGDADKIGMVVEASGNSQAAFRGAVSALGWIDDRHFRSIIIDLVSAKTWQYRSLGLAACGVRRVNPRAYLNEAAESSNLFLKTRALKAAGQLKRMDMLPVLQENFQHSGPVCRFEAARSALLLGDRTALGPLAAFILSKSKFTRGAMQVALRIADGQSALDWLKTLSRDPKHRRDMLIGAAIVGNSAYIPILIKQMKEPELARAAGDAFTIITGLDLVKNGLNGSRPDGFEFEADEENKDASDADEYLAWPDIELISSWWQHNEQAFPARTRFLAGTAITAEHCQYSLKNDNQRNRQSAALELALRHAKAPYFNTKASADSQQKRLTRRAQEQA
jgi:uncharacterized protein (TIGR02270 family)